MIRKLRIKFTAAAAGAVFLVLAVVLTIINVMNYRQVLWDADTVLDILSEHQGRFPENLPKMCIRDSGKSLCFYRFCSVCLFNRTDFLQKTG